MKRLNAVFLIALTSVAALYPGRAVAGSLLWEKELDSEIRFKKVHDTGIILVGTEKTVYGFDPKTGAEVWRVENLKKDYDVEAIQPVEGSNLLVYEKSEGMFKPSKIVCIDVTDGKVAWELNPQVSEAGAKHLFKDMPKDTPEIQPTGVFSLGVDRERGQFLIGFGFGFLWQGKTMKSKGERQRRTTSWMRWADC